MPMRIGFDIEPITPARTGVGAYCYYLLKALLAQEADCEFVGFASGFKPLASAEMLTAADPGDDPRAARFGTQNWAPIALADGKLLIRDQSRILCLKVAE